MLFEEEILNCSTIPMLFEGKFSIKKKNRIPSIYLVF